MMMMMMMLRAPSAVDAGRGRGILTIRQDRKAEIIGSNCGAGGLTWLGRVRQMLRIDNLMCVIGLIEQFLCDAFYMSCRRIHDGRLIERVSAHGHWASIQLF